MRRKVEETAATLVGFLKRERPDCRLTYDLSHTLQTEEREKKSKDSEGEAGGLIFFDKNYQNDPPDLF